MGERGSANVRVLQGLPLSPVVFLMWMSPILQKMEEKVRVGTGLEVEMPLFIDDRLYCIVFAARAEP